MSGNNSSPANRPQNPRKRARPASPNRAHPSVDDYAPGLTMAFIELSRAVEFYQIGAHEPHPQPGMMGGNQIAVNQQPFAPWVPDHRPPDIPPHLLPLRSSHEISLNGLGTFMKDHGMWCDLQSLAGKDLPAASISLAKRARANLDSVKSHPSGPEYALTLTIGKLWGEVNMISDVCETPNNPIKVEEEGEEVGAP